MTTPRIRRVAMPLRTIDAVRAQLIEATFIARGHAMAAFPGTVERRITVEQFERRRDTLHRFERAAEVETTLVEGVPTCEK